MTAQMKILRFAAVLLLVAIPSWSQQAKYGHDGPAVLPDRNITPGVPRPDATAQQLCAKGFTTKPYRKTTEAMKKRAYALYGAVKKPKGCCEVDHLISLELGGEDQQANLWPQPYEPRPGAHEKDLVENYLHGQVCAGKITLPDAQKEISEDWYEVYLRMDGADKKAAASHR